MLGTIEKSGYGTSSRASTSEDFIYFLTLIHMEVHYLVLQPLVQIREKIQT
jgi:hypothetical protein